MVKVRTVTDSRARRGYLFWLYKKSDGRCSNLRENFSKMRSELARAKNLEFNGWIYASCGKIRVKIWMTSSWRCLNFWIQYIFLEKRGEG